MVTVASDIHLERRSFVLRLMSSLGVPPDDVEDIAHQALLKFLARGYGELALDDKRERALLARIGYSTFVDLTRRRRALALGDGADDHAEPPEGAHRSACVERIRDLLVRARLDEADVALLNERYGDGLSAVAIARGHGLHVNTVRRRLTRLIERLRHAAGAETPPEHTRSARP